jgi:alpha-N-arabinofuranosidase
VHNAEGRKVAFFVLNRETSGPAELSVSLRGFPQLKNCEAYEISGDNLLAMNTQQKPDAVEARKHEEISLGSDSITARLRPLSWQVLSLSY